MARPLISLEEFFWQRVKKTETCWIWTGKRQKFGYGQIQLGAKGRRVSAHRASWEIHYGLIPEGLWVLHKCDNPSCVRPDHLWIGTHEQNMIDARRKGRMKVPSVDKWLSRTHCSEGHLFDEQNTYRRVGNQRRCRICHKLEQQRYTLRVKLRGNIKELIK